MNKNTNVRTNIYVKPNGQLNTLFYNGGKATKNLFTTNYAW